MRLHRGQQAARPPCSRSRHADGVRVRHPDAPGGPVGCQRGHELTQKPRGGRLPRRERRAQLLDSALEVFVAQGYHAAAMDDIAERAGVSKPVLYQHFPGKLDLYLALLDAACDDVIDNCRQALAATHDNKTRVAAAMAAFYAYVAADGGAFRLVFESDLTSEPAVREHVERVTTECAAMIADVIHDDTGLPGEASRLLAVSLVGMAPGQRAVLDLRGGRHQPGRRRSSWSAAWPGAASAATRSPTSTDHDRPGATATDRKERPWKSRSACGTHPASS